MVYALLAFGSVFCFGPSSADASEAELVLDTHETVRARVVEIIHEERKNIPGTDTPATYQTIRAEILEGGDAGKIVVIENDYLALRPDETFYAVHTTNKLEGRDIYQVSEPYRLHALLLFFIIFVIGILCFGGKPGVRGFLALLGSLLCIVFVLLPGVLRGYDPLFLSLGVSALIVIGGSYITHGVNKTTSAAVVGMLITILFTGALAYFAVDYARLSGFETEEAVTLNFNTSGIIDFEGLLLGSIMIGLLGVLYDVAIGQAVTVEELARLAPHVPRRRIFERALRIGQEHIGALVDTLAIAYVGVSLPLLLLYYSSAGGGILLNLNREVFATQIVRTLMGSIGLMMAVPITSLVAVYMLVRSQERSDQAVISKEEALLDNAKH